MKSFSSLVSILIIIGVIYWSFSDSKPSIKKVETSIKTNFFLDNALYHLKNISKKTHYVGSKEHTVVKNYLIKELQKLGLETEIKPKLLLTKNGLQQLPQKIY